MPAIGKAEIGLAMLVQILGSVALVAAVLELLDRIIQRLGRTR